MPTQPHYLLFCNTQLSPAIKACWQPALAESGAGSAAGNQTADQAEPREHLAATEQNTEVTSDSPRHGFGRWQFVLERLDGQGRLEVADSESQVAGDRLALLAVVRGLEALEQPSQVSLITTSRYVSRGLKYGLNTWRDADYQWDRFGVRMPIRNADLWQRVDQALHFHGVNCKLINSQFSPAGSDATSHAAVTVEAANYETTNHDISTVARMSGQVEPTEQSLPQFALLAVEPATAKFKLGSLSKMWWTAALAWLTWWQRRVQWRPAPRPARSAYFAT